MSTDYHRQELGVSRAYVVEAGQLGEHWVEIYLTLPGSQTTLLVTMPLPLDTAKAHVIDLH